MKVGFIGLGKLGLPVATCMASKGLDVLGYDSFVTDYPDDLSYEEGFDHLTNQGRITFSDLDTVVRECDPIFVAVQTPHQPEYEGITPIPETRVDFDYSHLKDVAKQLQESAWRQKVCPNVCVISTVLPGTMEREIAPLLKPLPLRYSPSFIAMGTTIRDFLDPEFVLIGGDDGTVRKVYEACGIDRFYETSVRNAELIKVSYNTFIGLKLAFANTLMEICHKTGCDVDEVTGALKLANRRLISGTYLDGGMGDGGGCHPRDNIALSWLARELDLSYDLFEATMLQREEQARWLMRLMDEHRGELPWGILGLAYKPGSRLKSGSPAILVQGMIERDFRGCWVYDPHTGDGEPPVEPACWLVGCKHPEFPSLKFPEGSVVIDPWRYIPDQPGVEVIRVGEGVDTPAYDRAA